MPSSPAAKHQQKKAQAVINRDRLKNIKIHDGCADCGYNKHPDALDFDHLPGFEKRQSVSWMLGKYKSWTMIEREVAKCEVVCANCHRIRTATRRPK